MKEQTYKKCPFCAESILEEAIKCKFCQSDLTGEEEDQIVEIINKPKEGMFLKTMNCGCIFIFIIIALIVIMFSKATSNTNKSSSSTKSTTQTTENVVGKHSYNKTNGVYQGKIVSIKPCNNYPNRKCYELYQGPEYSRNIEFPIDMVLIKETKTTKY